MDEQRERTVEERQQRAAARAADRGGYMAGLLREFQRIQAMNDRDLAAFLGCEPRQVSRLGLCREPRRTPPDQFRADIQSIAAFAQAAPLSLVRLVREVDVARSLQESERIAQAPFLAAARDAEATDQPDGAPEQPKQEDADGSPD